MFLSLLLNMKPAWWRGCRSSWCCSSSLFFRVMTSEIPAGLCNHVTPKPCLGPCATWAHITLHLIHLFHSIRCTTRCHSSSYFSLTLFCCQSVKSDKKHCFSLTRAAPRRPESNLFTVGINDSPEACSWPQDGALGPLLIGTNRRVPRGFIQNRLCSACGSPQRSAACPEPPSCCRSPTPAAAAAPWKAHCRSSWLYRFVID